MLRRRGAHGAGSLQGKGGEKDQSRQSLRHKASLPRNNGFGKAGALRPIRAARFSLPRAAQIC
jgi:hypothetical protein